MSKELAIIIEQSGIEKSKQTKIGEALGQFFEKADEWNLAIQSLEITEPTQVKEMELAKSIRLELKRKRLEGEKLIDKERANIKLRMSDDVLEDKLWLRTGQMMGATYANLEGKAQEKERFAEIWEANRILKLRSDRADILRNEPLIDKYIPYGIDLGIMTDDDFTNILNGAKLQRDAQIAAEQKAESERLALLKKQEDERIALEKEREEKRIAMEKENERLRLESIEKDKVLKAEQARAKAEKDKQDAAIEKERLEAAQKAKELEIARQKEIAKANELAEQLRIESEKQLAIERENSRIALEKQQADLQAEAQRKLAEREERSRQYKAQQELENVHYKDGILLDYNSKDFESERDYLSISEIGQSIQNGKSNDVYFQCGDGNGDDVHISLILNIEHAQKIINHLGKQFNIEVEHE